MELFERANNPNSIYETLILDVKWVTRYSSKEEFKEKEEELFWFWSERTIPKHGELSDAIYFASASEFPEFSKIVGASIAFKNSDNSIVVTSLNGNSEEELIEQIFEAITLSKRKYIAGHYMTSHIIPFLTKRCVALDMKLPQIIKANLSSKPWDSKLIDTNTLWKFNSVGLCDLRLIAHYLGLQTKKEYNFINDDSLSGFYYNKKTDEERKEYINFRSKNDAYLIFQILEKIRTL